MGDNKKENPGLAHAEDLALKSAAAYFGEEILPWLGVEEKVCRIAPTETIRLEMRHLYEDFLYEMANGSYYHFEFESDSLTLEDLKRFREYEAATARIYRAPVVTYVICSSGAKNIRDHITEGINTYRVKLIQLKDWDADQILKQTAEQLPARNEMVPLLFTPLMGGHSTQKERIQKSIQILKKTEKFFSKTEISKMEAILYVLASKFLNRKELESIKEEIAMTVLGQMIWEDALEKGRAEGERAGRKAGEQIGREAGERIGREAGERIGREAGEKLGREQASERYSRLILLLNEKNRTDLIIKAASDPEYLETLYREYGI